MKKDVVSYLIQAEDRLASVIRHTPDSAEVPRLMLAVEDIHSRMSPQDLVDYDAIRNFVESPADKAKRLKSEIAQMMANKDSQSI